MTLFFADLVREFSSAAGAGDFALGGAVPGHRRFGDVVPAGRRFGYAIAGVTHPNQWETGEGELGSEGALVRSPSASSAGGGLVAFSAGLKTVALTVTADWFTSHEEGGGDVAIGDVAGLEAALGGKLDGAAASTFGRSLIDDANAAAARGTLGLGAAAVKAVGTSGDAVPVLNGGATSWASGMTIGGEVAIAGGLTTSGPGVMQGGLYLEYSGGQAFFYAFNAGFRPFNVAGSEVNLQIGGTSIVEVRGAHVNIVTGAALRVGGAQVVAARRTGWAAPTGTASRASFDTGTASVADVAQRLKALIDDLTAHGLIGA